jgi:hypothetical protein
MHFQPLARPDCVYLTSKPAVNSADSCTPVFISEVNKSGVIGHRCILCTTKDPMRHDNALRHENQTGHLKRVAMLHPQPWRSASSLNDTPPLVPPLFMSHTPPLCSPTLPSHTYHLSTKDDMSSQGSITLHGPARLHNPPSAIYDNFDVETDDDGLHAMQDDPDEELIQAVRELGGLTNELPPRATSPHSEQVTQGVHPALCDQPSPATQAHHSFREVEEEGEYWPYKDHQVRRACSILFSPRHVDATL